MQTTIEGREGPPPAFAAALHQLQAQVLADQLTLSPLELIHLATDHGFSFSVHPEGVGDYPIPVALLLHSSGFSWPLVLPDPAAPDSAIGALASALGWPLLQQQAAATSAQPVLQQDVAAVQPQPQQRPPRPAPQPEPAPQQQAAATPAPPADLIGPGSPEHPVVDPALLQPITKAHRDKAIAAMRALSADQRKVLIARFRDHFQVPAGDKITDHITQQQHLALVYGFIDELQLQQQQGVCDV